MIERFLNLKKKPLEGYLILVCFKPTTGWQYLEMGDELRFDLKRRRTTYAIREAARDRLEKIYAHRSIFEAMFHSDFVHEGVVYEVVQFDTINESFWTTFTEALDKTKYYLKPVSDHPLLNYLPKTT